MIICGGCGFALLQASGVKVDNACKTIFQEIKMDKKFRYILFGFTPDDVTQIVVLKQADPSMQHQA